MPKLKLVANRKHTVYQGPSELQVRRRILIPKEDTFSRSTQSHDTVSLLIFTENLHAKHCRKTRQKNSMLNMALKIW